MPGNSGSQLIILVMASDVYSKLYFGIYVTEKHSQQKAGWCDLQTEKLYPFRRQSSCRVCNKCSYMHWEAEVESRCSFLKAIMPVLIYCSLIIILAVSILNCSKLLKGHSNNDSIKQNFPLIQKPILKNQSYTKVKFLPALSAATCSGPAKHQIFLPFEVHS